MLQLACSENYRTDALLLSRGFWSSGRFLRSRSLVIRIGYRDDGYGGRGCVLDGNSWLSVIPPVVIMLLRMLRWMLPMLSWRIPATVLLVLLMLVLRWRALLDAFLDRTKLNGLFLVRHVHLMAARPLLHLLRLLIMMLLLAVVQLLLLLLVKQMGRLRSLLRFILLAKSFKKKEFFFSLPVAWTGPICVVPHCFVCCWANDPPH